MPKGHYKSAGASIEYGPAGCLFPVDELDATVLQHRDAQIALNNANGSEVVIVAPTSLATSYSLAQHTLTAVQADSLSGTVRAQVADELDAPLETFDLIQIGKWNTDSTNHSLAEFTDA